MKAAGIISILFALPLLAAPPSFSPQDLWNWRRISTPQIDAEGKRVVYIGSWNDRAANAECANLWLIGTDGSDKRRLTNGAWRDRMPQWSPDGKRLAWISDRGGRAQIHVLQIASAAESTLETPAEPLEFAWSPDGAAIAFASRTAPELNRFSWAPPEILSRLEKPSGRVRIFVISAAGGGARAISPGNADFREPAWMSDGRTVLASNGAIWAFSVAGGAPRQLTKIAGVHTHPLPSPDGERIAWLATSAAPQSYAVRKLYVMNSDGARIKLLGGTLDRDASDPRWSSDSRTIYLLADDRGSTHVYAARNDGTARQVTSVPERLRGLSLADNGSAVAVRSTAKEAGSLVAFAVDRPAAPVKLASVNEELLGARIAGPVEEIHYDSAGRTIQAWLVKPPGFDAGRQYSLLVDVADAPRRMYGVEFQFRAQIFAARGWVVLCANPRGTPGYGEEFGNLIRSRYPGDDFDDLMAGVEFVTAKGYIDSKRIAIAGGLLAAWAIGHTSRFTRAIARQPIVDWTSDVATAPDGVRRATNWMGAMPWEDPDQYVKRSPIFSVGNFQTPTLVIGEAPESRQLYWALRQRSVETALMRTGGTPADQVAELEAMLAWLEHAPGSRP